jgi:hypothetical protein
MNRLLSWWRHPGGGVRAASAAASVRENDCEQDPLGALAELQEEQGRIAQELEETFVAYDQKLQTMARRLARQQEIPAPKELADVRQEQLELWRLVRRAQAASRSTRELERELAEWAERQDTAVPHGHPDHPRTRSEIIGSELRARERGADVALTAVPSPTTAQMMPLVAFSEGRDHRSVIGG